MVAAPTAITVTSSVFFLRELNIMLLGEEQARTLGVDTSRLKLSLLAITSLATGAAVGVSGLIGFVGLVIPHICRLTFGTDNRILVPASFLTGALFLIIADFLARIVLYPIELPVGAVTALLGAPLFIWLLRKG